jgi:hypothetical protein
VNPAVVVVGEGSPPAVVIHEVREAELDEMWSFVGRRNNRNGCGGRSIIKQAE